MLRHTFCHLPGIGPKSEQKLWETGVHSWETFLEQSPPPRTAPARKPWPQLIEESLHEYERDNSAYFSSRLPANQLWRLFTDFRRACAYIDIETTGLGSLDDYITTIVLYDGQYIRAYVNGINLDDFPRDVQDYKLLITYNGATFDLPFIERHFGIAMNHAHIDLRYILRALGYKGGLKRCEKQLGIDRPGLEDVDGYAAVLLWHKYKRDKNKKALETLLAYNVEDTVNLEILMTEAYNQKLHQTPFASLHQLPAPPDIDNPYTPDPKLVQQLQRQTAWRHPYSS